LKNAIVDTTRELMVYESPLIDFHAGRTGTFDLHFRTASIILIRAITDVQSTLLYS